MTIRRSRKCSLCPAWVESSAHSKVICDPCWRLLDELCFKAESRLVGQSPLQFNPFRTARSRAVVPRKPSHGAGISPSSSNRGDLSARDTPNVQPVDPRAIPQAVRAAGQQVLLERVPQLELFAG